MRLPAVKITRRILNILILVFIVELLFLGFLVYRQESVMGRLKKEIADKNEVIARYSATYREIPQLQETLNSLRSQVKAIEWNLPSYAYIPTFLAEIEQWARQCGVKLINISPQQAPAPAKPAQKTAEEEVGVKRGELREEVKPKKEEKPPAPYETISLNLQAEGDFYAVNRFIDGFRRFPKALSLTKLDITPQQREGKAPLLRVSLFLNIAVLSGGTSK